MQEIPEPQPLLCLSANLSLFALTVAVGKKSAPLGEMVKEVFNYEGTFGDGNAFRGSGWRYSDDGGFPEGVDLLELRGCMFVGLTMEDLELIGNFELLKEPEDTLGAGLFEPGKKLEIDT